MSLMTFLLLLGDHAYAKGVVYTRTSINVALSGYDLPMNHGKLCCHGFLFKI